MKKKSFFETHPRLQLSQSEINEYNVRSDEKKIETLI